MSRLMAAKLGPPCLGVHIPSLCVLTAGRVWRGVIYRRQNGPYPYPASSDPEFPDFDFGARGMGCGVQDKQNG